MDQNGMLPSKAKSRTSTTLLLSDPESHTVGTAPSLQGCWWSLHVTKTATYHVSQQFLPYFLVAIYNKNIFKDLQTESQKSFCHLDIGDTCT